MKTSARARDEFKSDLERFALSSRQKPRDDYRPVTGRRLSSLYSRWSSFVRQRRYAKSSTRLSNSSHPHAFTLAPLQIDVACRHGRRLSSGRQEWRALRIRDSLNISIVNAPLIPGETGGRKMSCTSAGSCVELIRYRTQSDGDFRNCWRNIDSLIGDSLSSFHIIRGALARGSLC